MGGDYAQMIHFGVSYGLRGWFAVVYDNDGPIQSGIGSYNTEFEAWAEAYDWAVSEGAGEIKLRAIRKKLETIGNDDFDF